jgi:glycosyltransferase involved in cell wall biosynthesis
VVVPVYNTGKYLERCLNSILVQSFTDFELILVDDSSTDGSLQLCNEAAEKDKRVKVIHKERNEGPALARLSGIAIARGVYAICLDSDDWVESEMLAEMYEKAISEDCDMVCCDYYSKNKDGDKTYCKCGVEAKTNIEYITEILKSSFSSLWNKIIKTEIYKKLDFPASSHYEDMPILIGAAFFSKKIGYLNKALYHYCYNEESLTKISNLLHDDFAFSKKRNKIVIDMFVSWSATAFFLIKNNINTDELSKITIKYFEEFCKAYMLNKKILVAFEKLHERLICLKGQNTLSKEVFLIEQKKTADKIYVLDKQDYGRIFINTVHVFKRILPPLLQEKLRKLFLNFWWK